MHDVTMKIKNTANARVTNSIKYIKNRNKNHKNSKYKNKLENKPCAMLAPLAVGYQSVEPLLINTVTSTVNGNIPNN